jgi:hypothetical protein
LGVGLRRGLWVVVRRRAVVRVGERFGLRRGLRDRVRVRIWLGTGGWMCVLRRIWKRRRRKSSFMKTDRANNRATAQLDRLVLVRPNRRRIMRSGFGFGDGFGYGDSSGAGLLYGEGFGSGLGFGSGAGEGWGSGCGSGFGWGYGSASGSGFGWASGIGFESGYGWGYGDGCASCEESGSGGDESRVP